MVRAAKKAQRLLNKAVSDYHGFLRTIPKGGTEIEADAVDDLQAFVDTRNKARDLTIYSPGGLNKSRPKQAQPMPDGLLDMINFSLNAIMEVVGVTPAFMGEMESKELTGRLQSQLVRSGLSVLATYFDAFKFYLQDQGNLLIDMVKELAEMDNGRLIRNVSGEGDAKYIQLMQSDIAQEYDVVVGQVPQTPGERQDTFDKLLELAGMLAGRGVDIMPMAIPFSPLKKDERDTVMEMMKPQPQPEPDPINREILKAEIEEKTARASKDRADAKAKDLDNLKSAIELSEYDEQIKADLEKTRSETLLNISKTNQ